MDLKSVIYDLSLGFESFLAQRTIPTDGNFARWLFTISRYFQKVKIPLSFFKFLNFDLGRRRLTPVIALLGGLL